MDKHQKHANRIVVISFIAFLCIFMAGGILLEDKDMSASERRKLNKAPLLSGATVISGKYMGSMEDYLLDQFPGRDIFRVIMAEFDRNVLHKWDTNGYYMVDGGVFKLDYSMSEKNIQHAAEKFSDIFEKNFSEGSCYYSIIPDKNYFVGEKYGYPGYDYGRLEDIMGKYMKNAQYIDIFDMLDIEDYYLTDLHWEQPDILEVADRIASAMGAVEGSISGKEYEKVTASDDFMGGYGGASAFNSGYDELVYLTNGIISDMKVYDYEKNAYVSVYADETAEGIDPYDVYLWGARALLAIENPHADSDKELVVFRDSFGSSMVPLLAQDYGRVVLVDLRYVTADYAMKLAQPKSDSDVLFMYSALLLNNSNSMKLN